jgi:hypothetical protein
VIYWHHQLSLPLLYGEPGRVEVGNKELAFINSVAVCDMLGCNWERIFLLKETFPALHNQSVHLWKFRTQVLVQQSGPVY